MWTSRNRCRYERKGLRYPTDLTDAKWALVAPHILVDTLGLRLNGWKLLGEFTEVETGKGRNALARRPQLRAALEACRKHKATLLIAKLDRLARNVYFVSSLMESNVEFVAVDMPMANRLTVHILAAVAEHEREMISQRTKAALAAAKMRGVELGRYGKTSWLFKTMPRQ